jgi:hypothetical protein
MVAHLLVIAFVLLGVAGALPGSEAQSSGEQGCTACQCGVAYCEDGREYFPEVTLDPLPAQVESSAGLEVSWRLSFRPGNSTWPPPNGTWGHGITGLILRWSPFERDQDGNRVYEPDPNTSTFPAVYPGNHSLHVDLDRSGTLYLVAYGMRDGGAIGPVSTPVTVEVIDGSATTGMDMDETLDPGEGPFGIPWPPWAATIACLAATAIVARRRLS